MVDCWCNNPTVGFFTPWILDTPKGFYLWYMVLWIGSTEEGFIYVLICHEAHRVMLLCPWCQQIPSAWTRETSCHGYKRLIVWELPYPWCQLSLVVLHNMPNHRPAQYRRRHFMWNRQVLSYPLYTILWLKCTLIKKLGHLSLKRDFYASDRLMWLICKYILFIRMTFVMSHSLTKDVRSISPSYGRFRLHQM